MNKVLLIFAILILLIVFTVGGVLYYVHSSVPDKTFVYNPVESSIEEIVEDSLTYDEETNSFEIVIDSNLINSVIYEEMRNQEMELPDGLEIDEVIFVTEEERIYVNAKYKGFNVPVSANIDISYDNVAESIFVDILDFKIASFTISDKLFDRYISDSRTFEFSLKDVDTPYNVDINDLYIVENGVLLEFEVDLNLVAQSINDAIAQLAEDYKNELVYTDDEMLSVIYDAISGIKVTSADLEEFLADLAGNNKLKDMISDIIETGNYESIFEEYINNNRGE